MTFQRNMPRSAAWALPSDLKAVRDFLGKQGAALANAAHLLGGPGAESEVYTLIEGIGGASALSRVQRKALVRFHRLLALDVVGDPDRIETSLFAEINPDDPVVHEICLLTEALERLLCEICVDAQMAGVEDQDYPLSDVA